MANSKTYLNVSYAEKDEVKALGGRWDPAKKKWYVPGNIDLAAFARWRAETDADRSLPTTVSKSATKKPAPAVITYAKDKNFVAYDGDEAPWD